MQSISAQDFNTFRDRINIGGGFGLSFGSYTYIQVSPVISYAVSSNFYLGLGLDYTYYKDSRYSYSYVYEGSIWAPKIFARYFIGDFFAQAEIQKYYYKNVYNSLNPSEMISETHYYAGGGYRSWVGANSFMYVMVLFDLQRSDFAFGNNPQVQIGFSHGF